MERPLCDVVGCGKHAVWTLLPSQEPLPKTFPLEMYLCEDCHTDLFYLHPNLAMSYVRLQENL